MKKNFNKIYKKFIDNNLNEYKYVYLTSNLSGFIKKYKIKNPDKLCNTIINNLLKKGLTVLLPAYSYTSKDKFYVEETKSNLSYLTKWSLKKKKFFRTNHPIFSFCVIGKNWKDFKNLSKSAFGKNSVWEILLKEKTSLLHIGRPFAWGNTMIHFVEFKEKAKYRFNKVFKTRVYKNKKYLGKNYSAFVQKNKFKGRIIETNTHKIGNLISSQKFYKNQGNNKNLTNFTHLDFKKTFEFMSKRFKQNNNIFINYR